MLKNKSSFLLSNIGSFLFLFLFIALALCLVFSKGVCCADDAYYAMTAKNLANGLGYANSLPQDQARFTLQPFDAWSGVGPTIILPAALFIKVFGNTYWAPGLASVFLWSLLLVLIGFYIRKKEHGFGFIFFTLSFLFLSYSLMTWHFEQWYALLGEVPAALLMILGILIFLDSDRKSNQILTGVLFYLAVQAKVLALVAIVVFIVALLFVYPPNRSESFSVFLRKTTVRICYLGLGFIIPLILFEAWKFVVLGPSGFIENWNTYIHHMGISGAQLSRSFSWLDLYQERSGILMDRFGISPVNIGLILTVVWLMIRNDKNLRRLFFVLTSIIAVYSFWWLFFSIGWARYFIICLVLLIFTISLPLLSLRSKSYILLYVVLIIIFSSNNWTKLGYSFKGLAGKYFMPTTQTRSLLETASTLSRTAGSDNERIATEFWATAADIEYIMPNSLNFTSFRDVTLMNSDSYWLAVNTRFVDKNDKDFSDLLERCKQTQEIDSYLIAYCGTGIPK